MNRQLIPIARIIRPILLQSAAAVALSAVSVSMAHAQEAQAPAVEQVVVSSSRITTAGFNAPTPTTVLSAGDLADQAQSNVFTAITELPSLMGSTGTAQGNHGSSTGTNGLSAFGIHGAQPIFARLSAVALRMSRVMTSSSFGTRLENCPSSA